jgi:hypothetical protein
MIKGRSPFPFEKIALGVSFNPLLREMIAETKRLCQLHNSFAVFIHCGKKTGEKQRELYALLNQNNFNDSNSAIHWQQGETVQDILAVCKMEVVDLILCGSNDKAVFEKPAGHVAAAIAKRSKCSVLIFAGAPGKKFEKVVINGSEHKKTDLTIRTGLYFCEKEGVGEIIIAEDESTPHGTAYGMQTRLKEKQSSSGSLRPLEKWMNYSPDKSISKIAFEAGADLVVTRSYDHSLLIFDRISGSDGIDDLLQNLPCNLLIVHSRLAV